MATDIPVKSRRLTRNKLASFLGNQELIKAFENLTHDVIETLPDAITEITDQIEDQATTANSRAAMVQALAVLALEAARLISEGPPPTPVEPMQFDDMVSQFAALREEVVALRGLINDRFQGPTP